MSVSRNKFDETKNYFEAVEQEGTPVYDADGNDRNQIMTHWLRRSICEINGNGSVNDGFLLSGSVTDPDIGVGNIYATGLKIEQPDAILASAQPNEPQTFPAGDGTWYLEITTELYGNSDDPNLPDPGYASIEAIKMWKADWTLKKVSGSSLPAAPVDAIVIEVAQEVSGAFTDTRDIGSIAAGADTGFQNREGGGLKSEHNYMNGLQGGTTDEYYHITEAEHDWVEIGAAGGGSSVHANLAGLQGGTTGEYYHLTEADYNGLTGAGSAVLSHLTGLTNLQGGDATNRWHLNANEYGAAHAANIPGVGNPFATISDLSGVTGNILDPVQSPGDLPTSANDKDMIFVEDDAALYWWNAQAADQGAPYRKWYKLMNVSSQWHNAEHTAVYNSALAITADQAGNVTVGAHMADKDAHQAGLQEILAVNGSSTGYRMTVIDSTLNNPALLGQHTGASGTGIGVSGTSGTSLPTGYGVRGYSESVNGAGVLGLGVSSNSHGGEFDGSGGSGIDVQAVNGEFGGAGARPKWNGNLQALLSDIPAGLKFAGISYDSGLYNSLAGLSSASVTIPAGFASTTIFIALIINELAMSAAISGEILLPLNITFNSTKYQLSSKNAGVIVRNKLFDYDFAVGASSDLKSIFYLFRIDAASLATVSGVPALNLAVANTFTLGSVQPSGGQNNPCAWEIFAAPSVAHIEGITLIAFTD